jgi:hypothetical protein
MRASPEIVMPENRKVIVTPQSYQEFVGFFLD